MKLSISVVNISVLVLVMLVAEVCGKMFTRPRDDVLTMNKTKRFYGSWVASTVASCGMVKPAILPRRALATSQTYVDDELELEKYADDESDREKHEVDKILGGNYVVPGGIPWQVNLKSNYGGLKYVHYCGGAIINEFWILTAADCIVGASVGNIKAVVGDHHLSRIDSQERQFDVELLLPHESYRGGEILTDDIGLIKLKTSSDVRRMKFSAYIQPVCLPIYDSDLNDGAMLIVSGWGRTYVDHGNASEVLKETVLPIVNQQRCKELFEDYPITPNVLCAGYVNGNTDLCNGDAGSPAVYKAGAVYILHGIASFGTGCTMPNFLVGFTRVTAYIDWIRHTILMYSETIAQKTIPSRPRVNNAN